ncbi:MAG: hypothetical protein HRU11_05175, partial [Parvularculaceae bacterium]|nr:hypothetical protein [Parvularculaceae bacterium]
GQEAMAVLAQAEAAYHYGDAASAHRFASIARTKLTTGTPEQQQAQDIIVSTAERAQQARQQRRR